MPFCDDCNKYWTPNSLPEDGRCPTCGIQLAEPNPVDDDDEGYKAPWHFKLLTAVMVVYLGWRFLQLFGVLPK
jgi:hypothetical protein